MMNATQKNTTTTYLKDYRPPVYSIETVDLVFDLQDDKTTVQSTLRCRCSELASEATPKPLILNGEKLRLTSLRLNRQTLSLSEYQLDEDTLTIFAIPNSDTFTLEITTEIYPEQNTALSGLYRSKAMYCTQCEATGFRRITYYLDRPDVMAKFTTTIYADKRRYPVLLSNGNCVGKGDVDVLEEGFSNRHWVKWEDPFPKPCYLFALVAGDLVGIEDYFVTCSGRLVTLKIYVERDNQDKCQQALEALKKAMRWDELTYGREYDLDIYMIVATNDFNMGAMENKGLNIFNSKYVLARPETATDTDYEHIDAVVGHEYFHNWSGNRVTCRDWFQLSLKEGLTVFREQQFSQDISKSSVSLIDNVSTLRSVQFEEDSGPMAHSVLPESYIEINNFYTATIYEKGAELIRMMRTLIGPENFRKGMDLYFERHDGHAVTIEDFVSAMEAAANRDLRQFRLWYSQAGTPCITVEEAYDPDAAVYRVTLQQDCPATPNQPVKQPMMIPIAVGLLGPDGKDLACAPSSLLNSETSIKSTTHMLVLTKAKETFTFSNIQVKPTLSILRGFSAPVKIRWDRSAEVLAFLLAHDADSFNRWEAGQNLTSRLVWQLVEDYHAQRPLVASALWCEAHREIIEDTRIEAALKAELLTLPSLNDLLQQKTPVDIDAVYAVRTFLKQTLAQYLKTSLYEMYEAYAIPKRYEYTPEAVASRKLKMVCLSYLMLTKEQSAADLCIKQWRMANNMTDASGALNALANWEGPERQKVQAAFFAKWQHDPLVLDKWFRTQALSELPDTLEIVKALIKHPSFEITNPNKVYSLIGAFVHGNLVRFHDKSGAGYTFLADMVLQLDLLNPQVASRMVKAFSHWKKFDAERQAKMNAELKRLLAHTTLSRDVFEIVSKCLA